MNIIKEQFYLTSLWNDKFAAKSLIKHKIKSNLKKMDQREIDVQILKTFQNLLTYNDIDKVYEMSTLST